MEAEKTAVSLSIDVKSLFVSLVGALALIYPAYSVYAWIHVFDLFTDHDERLEYYFGNMVLMDPLHDIAYVSLTMIAALCGFIAGNVAHHAFGKLFGKTVGTVGIVLFLFLLSSYL